MAKRVPARLSAREGRRFGASVGAAFLALGALLWWRGHPVGAVASGVLGGALALGALAVPERLGPVHRAWMGLAMALSRITTPIVMGVVFFGVLAPVGLIMRLVGHRPLRHGGTENSLWIRRLPGSGSRTDMQRQF